MIYDELRNFIVHSASVEQAEVYDDVVKVFDKFGLSDYLDVWDLTIGEYSARGEQAVVDALWNITGLYVLQLCQSCGITIDADLPLADAVEIADALFELPYYEDRQTMLAIMDSAENEQEKVCGLLALRINKSVDNLLLMVEDVRPNYCDRLREQIEAVTQAIQETQRDVKPQITAYQRFKNHLAGQPLWCDRLTEQVSTIGLPLQYYISVFLQQVARDTLDYMSSELVARDLVACSFLSADGYQAPQVALKAMYGQLYSDIEKVTALDMAINKLLIEVTRAEK